MLSMILLHFSGYTIESILNMPFCHFLGLYELVEIADRMDLYNTYMGVGVGTHGMSSETATSIAAVTSMKFSTKKQYKAMVTQEVKDKIQEQAMKLQR